MICTAYSSTTVPVTATCCLIFGLGKIGFLVGLSLLCFYSRQLCHLFYARFVSIKVDYATNYAPLRF